MPKFSKPILIDSSIPINSNNADFLYNTANNSLYYRNRNTLQWIQISGGAPGSDPEPGGGGNQPPAPSYLTTSQAALIYLSKSSASSTYLEIDDFLYTNIQIPNYPRTTSLPTSWQNEGRIFYVVGPDEYNDLPENNFVFNISNNGSGNYVYNGVSNPNFFLIRGNTYTFAINSPGHPFWIKTTKTIGQENAYNEGVTGNGSESASVTFVVGEDAPDLLYYNCEFHHSMRGNIFIYNNGDVVKEGSLYYSKNSNWIQIVDNNALISASTSIIDIVDENFAPLSGVVDFSSASVIGLGTYLSNDILPSQVENSNRYLFTNGSNVSWQPLAETERPIEPFLLMGA